ncbi:MAG TPA: ABC transporter substrate-binding protein [Pseudolabrys sp.]|nr:ABC transporter substrate-binding protein [Pseudolabrys sp.]
MRRREFIALVGGAVTLPLAARAQQGERVRRIGVLTNLAETDGEGQARIAALVEGLQRLGWTDGGNVRIEIRWGAGDAERYRRYAAELVAHAPDVLVPITSPAMAAVQQATRTIPIVFVGVIDPVGAGFVASLARPGGNVTGFALFEYGISGKWLALLKEIAPDVTRAAILRDTAIAAGTGQLGAIQASAPSLGMDLSLISLSDAEELERAISEFAHGANGGLIVTASPFGATHPGLIATLAARYRLPTVYPFRYFVTAGGLISYGPDLMSPFPPAAGYVDRILRGEKPADLPVQTPTKYELAINLKAAKAINLTVPQTLLARADEVIE